MPKVHFIPSDIIIDVPAGTLISDAAVKAGIEDLHLPCGGKGTCGRCVVEILSGKTEQVGHTRFDKVLADKGLVLSCQSRITEDIMLRFKETHDAAMRVVGDSHLLINEELLPDKEQFSPMYRSINIIVPPATIEEHYSDWQRLVQTLTCRTCNVPVRTDIEVLRKLAESLRAEDGSVTVLISEDDGGIQVLDIKPGNVEPTVSLGLAVDIGTTTIAVQLIDLLDGRVLSNATSYNAQMSRGADIISRIDYARTPERQAEMRGLVLDTVNELITGILDERKVSVDLVRTAFIAGNTTMIHLLLGLSARYIRESPYVPTVNPIPMLSAQDVGIAINPQAIVGFAPGVGSYVGGDITSGLLCTEIPINNEDVFLFLDIGTNGEIVLGNADWMVTCACSAGPAFEGSGIKCGMRATQGAIEYVEIAEDRKSIHYDVIGDCKPVGICGSGLICLLGELLLRGVVDQMGRFNMELPTDRLVQLETTRGFIIDWGANTADGNDLIITELDIENLMRTKAAIFAACSLILGNVGLDWDTISKVYIAGGFGRYLQIDDAVLIGLLPDLPEEKFMYIGNSSLTGAYIALMSQSHRTKLADIASKMTYIDLSSDTRYMDSYLGAMFLPHTDINIFPTVAKKLAEVKTSANKV
ncbi:MAG: ASKHA domain-containing protein [Armatimonadota bacterium]